MPIHTHVSEFAGLPVAIFDPHADDPADPAAVAWSVETDYDGGRDLFTPRLDELLARPWVGDVRALIIGEWGEAYERSAPIKAPDRLTGLRASFVGDIAPEEAEISWIQQGDLTELLAAGGSVGAR